METGQLIDIYGITHHECNISDENENGSQGDVSPSKIPRQKSFDSIISKQLFDPNKCSPPSVFKIKSYIRLKTY